MARNRHPLREDCRQLAERSLSGHRSRLDQELGSKSDRLDRVRVNFRSVANHEKVLFKAIGETEGDDWVGRMVNSQLCANLNKKYLQEAVTGKRMRMIYFSVLALTSMLGVFPNAAYACRIIIPGAGSKSDKANFEYFDHVAVVQTSNVYSVKIDPNSNYSPLDFIKLHVIKSYKGELPQEFFAKQVSDAVCGQDLAKNTKYLIFIDARRTAATLPSDPNLPVLSTTLVDITRSRVLSVDDEASADEIIRKATGQ
ncbi:hypothetical protein [Methylobacterium indicum]|uniref:hypothetical protein n=1 Tax=Methylobacterium indicum TaxID=1775910 RepID=UPI000F771CA2|nr:hypothetical protein [Methylobacterium indicum]